MKATNEKGKAVLTKTPVLESYRQLNLHEKYIYLLQTYWTKYDFDSNFSRMMLANSFRNLLIFISNSVAGQRIVKDNDGYTYPLYSEGAPIFHHLEFMGFGELELTDDDAKESCEDSIRAFIPNELGIYASRFLISEAIETMNGKNIGFILTALRLLIICSSTSIPSDRHY
ncbi:hypothetical protein [Desulfoscipio gibsoniae]